ncbi:glycosyltransferase family 4 protein [Flavobacteriaceae bacterium]|nr:glycosyltransferase family 4 protein [Flavobacteriaceae bacterium]
MKNKILIVTDFYHPEILGGAEISVKEFKDFLEKDYRVSVFCSTLSNIKLNESNVFRFKTSKPIFPNWRIIINLKACYYFYKHLKKNKYDLIHFQNISYSISYSVLVIGKFFGAKQIITFRDCTVFINGKFDHIVKTGFLKLNFWLLIKNQKWRYNPFRNLMIRLFLKCSDHNIAISNILKKTLESNKIKIDSVVYNRIKIDNNNNGLKQTKLNTDKIVNKNFVNLLFLGRASKQKGFDDLVKLLPDLKINFKNIKLICIGTSYQNISNDLKNFIIKNNLENSIDFYNWIDNFKVYSIVRKVQLVCFSSRYIDAFGRVITESICNNVPVIISNLAGAHELIKDEFPELVYNPLNNNELFIKINHILNNQDDISKKIINHDKTKYLISEKIDYYNSIYKNLLC